MFSRAHTRRHQTRRVGDLNLSAKFPAIDDWASTETGAALLRNASTLTMNMRIKRFKEGVMLLLRPLEQSLRLSRHAAVSTPEGRHLTQVVFSWSLCDLCRYRLELLSQLLFSPPSPFSRFHDAAPWTQTHASHPRSVEAYTRDVSIKPRKKKGRGGGFRWVKCSLYYLSRSWCLRGKVGMLQHLGSSRSLIGVVPEHFGNELKCGGR